MEKKKYGPAWIFRQTKGVRALLIVYSLLVLCIPVIQVLFAWFMKLFIDIATGNMDMSLSFAGLCSAAVIAAAGIVVLIQSVLGKLVYGKIECNLRAALMNTIFSRRMTDISGQHTGELLTRLTEDVQTVSMCPAAMLDKLVQGAVSALLATAALFFLNWKIAVILLVLMPLLMALMGAISPCVRKASAADKGNEEVNRSLMQENLSRIMLIKTYFMQGKIIEKVKHTYDKKLKSGMKLGMWEGLTWFAGSLFGNVMSLVTLGLGACFVLKGETTVGSLIMIVQLLNYIVTPISGLSAAVAQIGQAVASADRIGMIYELPAEKDIPAFVPVNAAELTVRDLCFSYGGGASDGGKDSLLRNINMSFSKGEVTGIVGKSGSGKSTLLRLLIGLYKPQSGTVGLKTDSGMLSDEQILPQTAYVPPDDYLFSGTIADNIIMAEQAPRQDDMLAAASEANISDLIQSLPQGFDTMLGEGGGTVSNGQAQRIAIARAIYKKAQVIVFDEPTANLDADSIEKFQSAVRKLAKDHICIIVTHDISTIAVCDSVYTLDGADRKTPPHLTGRL